VRGFALKFYTEEATGIWSATTRRFSSCATRSSFPISFTRRSGIRNQSAQQHAAWDFWSLSPESLHQVTILMSDRGLPKSLRHVNGYGSHTYSFINARNERFWVKFHFKTLQGIQFMTNAEAEAVVAKDPREFAARFVRGHRAGRISQVEIPGPNHAGAGCGNVSLESLRLTKVWPHKDYPLMDVGILELNRNPENYFAEVEQSAFSPSNIVPGIGFSPDKMLQARIFSYADAHRYRIGTHYEMLPVNRPKVPVRNYHADARCVSTRPKARTPTTNRTASTARAGRPLRRAAAENFRRRRPLQSPRRQRRLHAARRFVRLMTAEQQQRLFKNIAAAMAGVPEEIVQRQLFHFHKADPRYADGVAKALGLNPDATGK